MISAVGGSQVIFFGFGFHFGELHDTAQRPIRRLRPLFLSLSVQLSIGCGDPESSVPAWPNGSGSHGWFTFNVWPNNQCGKWQSWTTRFAITNFWGQFPMIRPQSVLATKTGTLRVLVLVLLESIISKYQRIKSMSRKYKAVRQPIVEDLVRKPNPPEEMDNNKSRCKSYRNIRSQKSDFTSHRRGSEKAGGHWWNSRPWVTVPMGPSELNGVYTDSSGAKVWHPWHLRSKSVRMEPPRAEANALGCAGLRYFSAAPLTPTKVKHIWVWLILVMVLLVYCGLAFPLFSLFLFFWRLVLCYLTYANRTGQSHQVPFHCSGCSGMSRYCPDIV